VPTIYSDNDKILLENIIPLIPVVEEYSELLLLVDAGIYYCNVSAKYSDALIAAILAKDKELAQEVADELADSAVNFTNTDNLYVEEYTRKSYLDKIISKYYNNILK